MVVSFVRLGYTKNITMHLNLTVNQKKAIARKEIKRVADILGKSPSKVEYKRQKTEISYGQIIYVYKRWNDAILDAGLPLNLYRMPLNNEITKQQLIDEFIRAANAESQMPSFRQFRQHSNISLSPYLRYFKKWNNVKVYVYDNYREQLKFTPPRILERRRKRRHKVYR